MEAKSAVALNVKQAVAAAPQAARARIRCGSHCVLAVNRARYRDDRANIWQAVTPK